MNATQTQQARPIHMPTKSDAELKAEAIAELERMERARNAKKSGYKPKRRGGYDRCNR